MPGKKCLVCVNLLGDSVYLLGPVKKFISEHREEADSIVVMDGAAGQLFRKAFSRILPVYSCEDEARQHNPEAEMLYLEAGRAAAMAFQTGRQIGHPLHITDGFAMMLGVDMEGKVDPPLDWQSYTDWGLNGTEHKHTLIAPFSRSCAKHTGGRPNKTLDDWKWESIVRFLRRHQFMDVKAIGLPSERLKQVSLAESDYVTTTSLEEMELALRQSQLVVTIDNGIAHLASALYVPTIVLWPRRSSMELIAPLFSPRTAILQIGDPHRVMPCQVLTGMKAMLSLMEKSNEKKEAHAAR